MNGPNYSIMRKLIIAIGIIAAILAIVISFKTKGQLQMILPKPSIDLVI